MAMTRSPASSPPSAPRLKSWVSTSSHHTLSGLVLGVVAWVSACGGRPKPLKRPRLKVAHDATSKWLRPGKQTRITPEIQKLARSLKDDDPWITLRRIHRWVLSHNRRTKRGRVWRKSVFRKRTAAELLESGELTGCGDYAVLLAALFRAAGLPAIYVGSLKKEWVKQWLDGGGGSKTFKGHSFLEVYVQGRWILVDSTEAYYWTGYDPSDPNLPRGYYAYGKARDPWALGLRSLSVLIQSMKKIVEKVDVTAFKKPNYTQGFLAPRVVVVSTGRVVRKLKPRLRTVRFEFLPLRMLRRRPQRAEGKDVLVLIKNSRAPRRLPLLGPPLNIQKAQDALSMEPHRYPRGIAQKHRFICVITASTVKGLVQEALSVLEVRDADEKALRPRKCVSPKTASPKTPSQKP